MFHLNQVKESRPLPPSSFGKNLWSVYFILSHILDVERAVVKKEESPTSRSQLSWQGGREGRRQYRGSGVLSSEWEHADKG